MHDREENKVIGRARVILSQVIACSALNLLLVDLGMSISFVTVVLPEVLNAKEGLSINEYQASWFGSIAFLCQPLGSIFSGPLLDYCGRRRALFLVNIPHVIAWMLMHYAWNLPSLFLANAILGLGTGIMEAPSVTYVGEVSEPSVRGTLTTLTNAFTSMGIFASYLLGTVLPWRQAALLCLVVPLSTMLLVLLVPETPIWLLSKGRKQEALQSLCRLRGWAPPAQVKPEFDQLVQYNEVIQQCVICSKMRQEPRKPCQHKQKNMLKRLLLKLKYVLFAKETSRPFILVMAYFLFYTLSGLGPVKPNMLNVCGAFGMSYDSKTIVVIVGALTIATTLVSTALVKIIRKRKLVIGSMFGCAVCSLALSVYAKIHISPEVLSYEVNTFPNEKSVVPLVLFLLLVCFTGLGIPWVLLSEVFPFRSRGMATGLAAAGSYVVFFLAAKTNYDLEATFHLSGAFALYAIFGFLGTVFLYFLLPETENRTLLEIEAFYKGDYRIFADDPFINCFKRYMKKEDQEEDNEFLPVAVC